MKKIIILTFLLFSFVSFGATRKIVMVNYEVSGVKQWVPGTIIAKEGETVEIELRNRAKGPHGFMIPAYKVTEVVKAGKNKTITFKADKEGLFDMKCHMHKAHVGGQLLVVD